MTAKKAQGTGIVVLKDDENGEVYLVSPRRKCAVAVGSCLKGKDAMPAVYEELMARLATDSNLNLMEVRIADKVNKYAREHRPGK